MSLLPTRDKISEIKFVQSLTQNPQRETIIELISQALDAKRIQKKQETAKKDAMPVA